jgi:predicted dehydrogenase
MIKIGIIGCGAMGSNHQAVFDSLTGAIEVTATVDIDIEKANSAKEILNAKFATTDYREIWPYVDAVLIATPHDLHHEQGMAAFAQGKHVLMEKPMAISEAECIDLIRASEESRKTLMVAYPMRYQPLVVKLKELLDNKYLGEPFHIGIFTEQLTQPPADSWMVQAKRLGGGQFFSHGCHYIDLLLWFLGEPEVGVHLGTRNHTEWMEKEGTSDAIIKFANGAIGHHFGTWGARATRHGYAIHAHCERGMLEADITGGVLYAHHGFKGTPPAGGIGGTLSPDPKDAEVILAMEGESKYLQGELEHFAHCIATGEKPLTDGPGSLAGLRVIWALLESEKNKTLSIF